MSDVGLGVEAEAIGQKPIALNVLGPEQLDAIDRWMAEIVVRILRDRRGEEADERL
jgi:hypothetical protein